MKKKSKTAYKTISEAAKEIGLINTKNNKPNTHTLDFGKKILSKSNQKYYLETEGITQIKTLGF